ncbi:MULTISPECIES: hypothetical protein [Streptomyces]|uniref:Uncharacterized protein n=1 Tax=Streptomyces cadmiisoli TaxID=2184053 RepID=A0A2Z4J288_9ACTN|nr:MULTISPECIES: hypothetical protein [Streptomyces]AWW39351.1 hypothetical protein DN051_24065 [Streptomyces cadmiisoli]KOV54316.1 hypothetical protein ADL00_31425 [Streptomyces sp. AS58]
MPRPTAAQLAYGSLTVIASTFAMLLLSQTTSGAGIAVIAVTALALGLLVAMTVPMPRRTPTVVRRSAPADRVATPLPATAPEPVREATAS